MDEELAKENIKSIAEAAELACVIEASSEKPGNVTPTHDFADTRFDDFIAGSKALKPAVKLAAYSGYKAGIEGSELSTIKMGALIKKAVINVEGSHSGGNTHLGIAILFIPLSAAAGLCLAEGKNHGELKRCLHRVMFASTSDDAVNLYDAINHSRAGGLLDSELDVRKEESRQQIIDTGLNLLDILKISSDKDMLARQLVEDLKMVFEESIHVMAELSDKLPELSDAVIQTYLVLLSKYPDTLIAKKAGAGEAERIRERAAEVLEVGGVLTDEGRRQVGLFDRELRVEGNQFNPGTTADLIAATIFVTLLKDVLG